MWIGSWTRSCQTSLLKLSPACIHDKECSTEEPCRSKDASTVLEPSGGATRSLRVTISDACRADERALLAFLSAEKPLSKEEGYTDDFLPCWSHRYGSPNMVINRSIVLACAISSSFERLHLTGKQ